MNLMTSHEPPSRLDTKLRAGPGVHRHLRSATRSVGRILASVRFGGSGKASDALPCQAFLARVLHMLPLLPVYLQLMSLWLYCFGSGLGEEHLLNRLMMSYVLVECSSYYTTVKNQRPLFSPAEIL